MKAIFLPLAAIVVLSAAGSVFAGTIIVPETKPNLTINPIIPPVEIKVEPAKICPPTAQKVCESNEVKVEPKSTPTTQVKVEPKPAEPIQVPITDKPTQN